MRNIFIIFIISVVWTNVSTAQDDWVWTKGPTSGVISTLTINSSGDVFCGTNMGVYRSTDDGGSWQMINNGLDVVKVTCSVNNPANQNIFIGTEGGGVFRSSDNGNSWEPVNSDSLGFFLDIASLTSDVSGNIYCGTYSIENDSFSHLFKSSNNGKNWKRIFTTQHYMFSGRNKTAIHSISVNNIGHIYIATDYSYFDDGIITYRSADNGNTWEEISSGLFSNDVFNIVLTNAERDIFLSTVNNGIYRSTNNGATWDPINNNLLNKHVQSLCLASDGQLLAGTVNGYSNGGVYRSTNNGDTWRKFNNGLKNLEIYSVIFDNRGFAYAATDGGVYKTTKSIIVGVEEYFNISQIEFILSPNPATDNISISFSNSELSNTSLSIYNSLGIEIKRFYDKELFGKSSISFSTEELPSGVYYCSLFFGANKITKSFEVLR